MTPRKPLSELMETWEKLRDAATKGPWNMCNNSRGDEVWFGVDSDADPTSWVVVFDDCYSAPTQEDAAFIAAARLNREGL